MANRLQSLLLCAMLALTLLTTTPLLAQDSGEPQRAVLITGATTGIGRVTAEHLASNGFFVYAGARKQADMDELNAIDNIMAVKLDVTDQEQIDAAVETIRNEGRGLYGLINNAGVSYAGPMIEMSEDDFHFVMDVNVYGVVRVTKAFAPLIIESKGRISTTGSISGFLSGPFGGPYSMSKHAIEAYTEALAGELERFDVEVSVVEPGNYDSEISRSRIVRMLEKYDDPESSLYADEMKQMLESDGDRSRHKPATEVAEVFYEFLTTENPEIRYMVVPRVEEARFTIGAQFGRIIQTNNTQAYTFTREELIEMLDKITQRLSSQ